jgi:predicted RNase H-like HicB family nuclease
LADCIKIFMVTEGYGGALHRYPRCAATQPEKHQVLSKGRHILSDGGCFLMTFRFQVCFEPEEDGGYHAYVPALPGCHSYGRTIEEAERNIKEAILLYLDGLKKHGLPLPSPQDAPYLKIVEVAVRGEKRRKVATATRS